MESLKKTEKIFSKGVADSIKMYLKLAELEKEWPRVVGSVVAERSAPVACEFTDEGPLLTINVEDAAIVQAMKFRRTVLIRSLSKFLGEPAVKIEICVGKVVKPSTVKEPLPAFKRRAPILISGSSVEEAASDISQNMDDPELAEIIAKLKVLAEKRAARKNR